MTKNAKIYLKFQNKYEFIINDKYLVEARQNHFDKNGAFIAFLLAFLENKMGSKKLYNQLTVNKDEWSDLFLQIYKEQSYIDLYKKLEINPVVPLEQTIRNFDCFDNFIQLFIRFVRVHELNLNISEDKLKLFIKNGFGYLLYNCIDCKIPYSLENILLDHDYENKLVMAVNNTRLFSLVKQSILENCKDKINNLIVLLLGMSRKLNYDK